MTTILDIAKLARVSKSTVSRVINGQSGVSKKSRDKVMAVIEETNFLPNKAARTLKSSESNSILILFHRPSKVTIKNPFYLEIVSEISILFENAGYDIILQTYKESQEEIEATKSKIANQFVKGIVILSSPMDETFLSEIDKLSIPTVVIGKISEEYDNIYSIDTDNYKDSYNLVQLLIDNGHEDIICIHPPTDVHVSMDRLDGFIQCMKDNNLPVTPDQIIETGYTIDQTLQKIDWLFKCKKKMTAVFATDVIRTLCVYKKANQYGYRIPDDLSIICFSSDTYSPFFFPEPSGIEIPVSLLASHASKQLLHLIHHETDVLKTTIVETNINLTTSLKKNREN